MVACILVSSSLVDKLMVYMLAGHVALIPLLISLSLFSLHSCSLQAAENRSKLMKAMAQRLLQVRLIPCVHPAASITICMNNHTYSMCQYACLHCILHVSLPASPIPRNSHFFKEKLAASGGTRTHDHRHARHSSCNPYVPISSIHTHSLR